MMASAAIVTLNVTYSVKMNFSMVSSVALEKLILPLSRKSPKVHWSLEKRYFQDLFANDLISMNHKECYLDNAYTGKSEAFGQGFHICFQQPLYPYQKKKDFWNQKSNFVGRI